MIYENNKPWEANIYFRKKINNILNVIEFQHINRKVEKYLRKMKNLR